MEGSLQGGDSRGTINPKLEGSRHGGDSRHTKLERKPSVAQVGDSKGTLNTFNGGETQRSAGWRL